MDNDLSIAYIFVRNLFFLIMAGVLFTIVAKLLVKDPAERRGIVKGVWAALIILGAIGFWSVANLRLPAFDQVAGTVTGTQHAKAATVASVPAKASGSITTHKPTPSSSPSVTSPRFDSSLFSLDAGKEIDGQFSDGVGYRLYTIQPGDTVFNISKRFGISQSELASRNGVDLKSPLIKAGETLKIPIQ
jgi:energy-coupling factor transporter transmembrane protein EcfT